MRILDTENDKSLKDLILYLTKEEAIELKDDLEGLIIIIGNKEHVHLNHSEYKRELTITLYNTKDLSHFDDRSKKLINEDI
ncbi:hypothetical protein V7056_16110 [Bacillus sp. JJ664]